MNDIRSFVKICEISEGQNLISTLGNLSEKMDKRTYEEIRQFVEKKYLLEESRNSGNTGRNFVHVKNVVQFLVDCTVEDEQKELINRRNNIDQQVHYINCEARNRKRKLLNEREDIDKRIKSNDTAEGIETVFQAVNLANQMKKLKTVCIKQETVFISGQSLANENICSPSNQQVPEASHYSSPHNSSSDNSSFMSCVSSQKSDDSNQSDRSSDILLNTSTSDIFDSSLENNRPKNKSVPNFDCGQSQSVTNTQSRSKNKEIPLRTKNDEIFGFRKNRKSFSCASCDYKAKNCADLQKHSTFSHGIGEALRCEECDKTYVRLNKFQMHQNTHHARRSQKK